MHWLIVHHLENGDEGFTASPILRDPLPTPFGRGLSPCEFAHLRCLPGYIWFASSPVFTLLTYTMVGGHLGDRDYLIGLQAAVFLCVHLLLLSLASATVRLLSLLLIMRSGPARQARQYKFVPVHQSACFCTIFISLLFVVLWYPSTPAGRL